MDKLQILKTMVSLQTVAENEDSRLCDFLPLESYRLLGDPNRFLILGGRGTGKTRVFHTLLEEDGFRQVIGSQKNLFKPNASNSIFIAGYNQEDNFYPGKYSMDKYTDDRQAAAFWAGSVVILLLRYFQNNDEVLELFRRYLGEEYHLLHKQNALKEHADWIKYMEDNPEIWDNLLDDVNDYLVSKDLWIFFAYDSLDCICTRYVDLFPYIRTLLSFWYSHLRRWSRIKCRIFLRNDLYNSEILNFPDASKLGGNCMKLEWNTVSLYRLFIKRLANAGDKDTLLYLNLTEGLVSREPEGNLGYIPTGNEEIIRKFIYGMIGKYMGNNAKKGDSYAWAPNHLQDTHGVLSPRSFLKCFSAAARQMTEREGEVCRLSEMRLLSPPMLQGAVQEVSADRVAELRDEYAWLEQLQRAFAGVTLLADKKEFIQRISMDLWSDRQQKGLPATTPQGIFDMLQKLGIVFVARDGRVNVPEIYLHGFGMKRKGGIRRPK